MPRRSPGQVRGASVRLAAHPKKGLAQHFLTDRGALARIVEAAELETDDTIVEVGPGRGVLTRALAARVRRVIAIELDAALCRDLEREMAPLGNVTVVQGNILDADVAALLAPSGGPLPPYKVVANIPYYITGAILRFFLETGHRPSRLVLLVQKEVAQSVAAGPGEMSVIGVSVQLYGQPRVMGYVPPGAFHPPPKVESAILRIDVYAQPAAGVRDTESFFRVVRAGFSNRRKQIRNALANGLRVDVGLAGRWLAESGIDATRRPQTLSVEEWALLADVVRREAGAQDAPGAES